jgi:hypothetical protein
MDFSSIPNAYEISVGVASAIVAILGLVAGFTSKKAKQIWKKMLGLDDKKNEFSVVKLIEDLKLGSIYEKLAAFRQKYDGSRIRICKFHNGGNFLDGTPIKKFSATHETCRPGSTIESFNLQNVQLTVFWELIDYVRKNSAEIINLADVSEVSNVRNWKQSRNIESFSVLPIHTNDFISGFVVIEWDATPKLDDTQAEEFAAKFKSCRDSIELDLSQREK